MPLFFFRQTRKGVHRGSLVSADGAINYADARPGTDARIIFFAGRMNKCFKSESQENSYNFFNKLKPGFHKLYLSDTYSHLDIFLGRNAYKDIFPVMISELNA